MTAFERGRSQSAVPSASALRTVREVESAWRNDVALEMWIDVTSDLVAIRLEGVLDDSTGANLIDVVRECMAEGRWDFELDTSSLRIAGSGWAVLDRVREQVHAAGGHLRWDSATVA
jgi:hypothetical protein